MDTLVHSATNAEHGNLRSASTISHRQTSTVGDLLSTKTRRDAATQPYVSRSFLVLASSCECWGKMLAVPKMVAISPCMKAQGTEDPARGHRSPLGQYTCKHKTKHQYAAANVALSRES